MSKHTHEFGLELILGGLECGDEIVVTIEFSYRPGCGPTGPTYASGGDPGYPPEIEVEKATLRDEKGAALECPNWLFQRICDGVDHGVLIEVAEEDGE